MTATGRPALSARQVQILALLADGATTGEAAVTLALSRETIKTHLKRATQTLGARNGTHAVVLAFRVGLLDLAVGAR